MCVYICTYIYIHTSRVLYIVNLLTFFLNNKSSIDIVLLLRVSSLPCILNLANLSFRKTLKSSLKKETKVIKRYPNI